MCHAIGTGIGPTGGADKGVFLNMASVRLREGLSSKWVYALIAVFVIASLLLSEYVVGLARNRVEQVRQMEATLHLAQLRARVESEVNSVLFLTRSLTAFISVNPQSSPERWRDLSRQIKGDAPLVRNIGLAPDNVIRFLYPLAGNEAAIGLNYRNHPEQWRAVEEAMLSGRITLAGPVSLIQGGRGLIARTPIYYQDGNVRHYWGLASVVINYDQLLEQSGVSQGHTGYRVAIRGMDGKGDAGDIFFGDADVFEDPLARMPIYFPSGSWLIAARPVDESMPSVLILRMISWLIIAVLSGGSMLMIQLYRLAYRQSLTDPLTGGANRRLLIDRTEQCSQQYSRTGIGFSLLFIDLNEFKQVNDCFGHHVGDELLVLAAARIEQNIRLSDTLARNGGDEFIVLLPGMTAEHAGRLATKIEQLMEEPFMINEHAIAISASAGFAAFPGDTESVNDVIQLADSRMYARKREKKERVSAVV